MEYRKFRNDLSSNEDLVAYIVIIEKLDLEYKYFLGQ